MRLAGHKRHLAALATGFIASAVVYSKALGPYLTFPGEAPVWEFLKVFLLPLTATCIFLIVQSLRAPRAGTAYESAADAAIDGIVFFIIVFLVGVHALLLAVLLSVPGVGPWASRGVVVLLGLTLVGIGNLLPRTRPNHALGIRTARTLADRQLWIMTHRVIGYVAVAVGVTTVVGGLVVEGRNIPAVAGSAGLIGAAITAAYYWRYSVASHGHRQV